MEFITRGFASKKKKEEEQAKEGKDGKEQAKEEEEENEEDKEPVHKCRNGGQEQQRCIICAQVVFQLGRCCTNYAQQAGANVKEGKDPYGVGEKEEDEEEEEEGGGGRRRRRSRRRRGRTGRSRRRRRRRKTRGTRNLCISAEMGVRNSSGA